MDPGDHRDAGGTVSLPGDRAHEHPRRSWGGREDRSERAAYLFRTFPANLGLINLLPYPLWTEAGIFLAVEKQGVNPSTQKESLVHFIGFFLSFGFLCL